MISQKNALFALMLGIVLVVAGGSYIYVSNSHSADVASKNIPFRDPATLINGGDYT